MVSNAEKCQKCYACQQGVSPDVTVDTVKGRNTDEAKCKNCYTCQQGVSPTVNASNRNKGGAVVPTQFIWYVFPTNGCNLRCTYCYANNQPGMMSEEIMHETLRWLFNKQPHKNINVHFFGGEPTFNWSIVRNLVSIGNVMARDAGIKVDWSMTTNGTLLNVEMLDWMQENFRKNTPFLLSLDGRKETHDKHRLQVNGKGSFDKIPIDEILKRFPNLEIRPTIEPDTVADWFEDFCWLRNRGFKNIAIEIDYEAGWSDVQVVAYEKLLEQLGRYYMVAKKSGSPIRMKWIDGVRGSLASGQVPSGKMCGVAYNCSAIDHQGYIMPCQRYASYNDPDTYAIGHVTKGIDEFKLLSAQNLTRDMVRGDVSEGYDCSSCPAWFTCFKGCNAANRKWNGKREVSIANHCRMFRLDVKMALSVLGELGELRLVEKPSCSVCK